MDARRGAPRQSELWEVMIDDTARPWRWSVNPTPPLCDHRAAVKCPSAAPHDQLYQPTGLRGLTKPWLSMNLCSFCIAQYNFCGRLGAPAVGVSDQSAKGSAGPSRSRPLTGTGGRLEAVPDEVTPDAISVSFPLQVIDNHRDNVKGVRVQAMEGDRLGRHSARCVGCQDTVESMGQATVTLEQSETVRGTGGGACCIDKGPISLDVGIVYQTQIQSADPHCDRVAVRRWCRASEPTGVGFGIPVSDGQAVSIAGGDAGPIADLNPAILRPCHHWQGEGQGDQCRQGCQIAGGGGGGG